MVYSDRKWKTGFSQGILLLHGSLTLRKLNGIWPVGGMAWRLSDNFTRQFYILERMAGRLSMAAPTVSWSTHTWPQLQRSPLVVGFLAWQLGAARETVSRQPSRCCKVSYDLALEVPGVT